MLHVRVCAREEVHAVIRVKHGKNEPVTHVLSLLDPNADVSHIKGAIPHYGNPEWTHMVFRDITDPGNPASPSLKKCEQILELGRTLSGDHRLLVHCEAGISRSTCAALALLVQDLGGDEAALELAYDEMVRIRVFAHPNPLMASYFDKLLQLDGKFVALAKRLRDREFDTFNYQVVF